jgi:hypothetical protein
MRAARDDQTDVLHTKAVIGILLVGDGTIVVASLGCHWGHRNSIAYGQTRRQHYWLKKLAVFHVTSLWDLVARKHGGETMATTAFWKSNRIVDLAHVIFAHTVPEDREF